MSQFYDDDMDYEDEVPEFQDESEFDDYLNDEEYKLMSDMFPRAKKELADYQGWTNLAVKVAIFDHDFDFDNAMIELKRSYKKKKSEETQVKMSALEQLARRKALSARKQNEAGSVSTTTPKAANLLSSLQKKRISESGRISQEGASSRSLLQRKGTSLSDMTHKPATSTGHDAFTAKSSLKDRLSSLANRVDSKSAASESKLSLSARLSVLKKARNSVQQEKPNSDRNEIKKQEGQVPKSPAPKPAIATYEQLVLIYNSQPSGTHLSQANLQLGITRTILSKQLYNFTTSRPKRKHDELFTVFYPDTNNQAAKKQAVTNFQKPSPDDVVLDAQRKAFEEVAKATKGVEKMTIETSESRLDDSEDDDYRPSIPEPVVRSYKKATVPTKPKKPIDLELHFAKKKPHLSFVVLGHVDAGKSTLMGRLLFDVGAVDNKLIRKLKRESELAGKSSFHLAWVMDQTSEERARGVTVDICTSDFKTRKATFTIVDAPGHRDFVPNAIAGVSQVDVAVLSIDCSTDAFESGFNLDGQTKEHTLLARSLGVRHIIVAMNKMDSVDWYEGRFEDIKFELRNFFEDIGIKEEQLSWVPCSGLSGEGVYETEYPVGQTWYKGPSLVKELELLAQSLQPKDLKEIEDSPFVFSVMEVSPGNKANEAMIFGRVESGHIQSGETITIYPSEQSVLVDQISSGNDHAVTPVAVKGDFVSLKLRNAFYEDIQSGDIAAIVGYDIPSAQEFTAQILTFKLDRPLLPGTSFMFFRGSCEQPARVKRLVSTVDKSNSEKILKKKVKHLGSNQAAIVEIELTEKKRRVPMLPFDENKHLARIVLRKEGRTIAAGIIKSLDL